MGATDEGAELPILAFDAVESPGRHTQRLSRLIPPQRVNCHVNNPQAHCSCCSYHVFTFRPTPWLSLLSFEGPTRRALAHPGICNYVDRPQR
jgi:hypothetical protein